MTEVELPCHPELRGRSLTLTCFGLARGEVQSLRHVSAAPSPIILNVESETTADWSDMEAFTFRWQSVDHEHRKVTSNAGDEDRLPLALCITTAEETAGEEADSRSMQHVVRSAPEPLMILLPDDMSELRIQLRPDLWRIEQQLLQPHPPAAHHADHVDHVGPVEHDDASAPPRVGSTLAFRPSSPRTVFLVTNRTRQTPANGGSVTAELGSALMYAKCNLGDAPSTAGDDVVCAPSWLSHEYFAEFCQLRLQQLARDAPIVVFVHGFANTWQAAVQRSALLDRALRDALTVCFAWPSQGKFGLRWYLRDEQLAMLSQAHLTLCVQQLRASHPGRRLVLVAHSMGSRPTFHCLLSNATLSMADHVLFVAPDLWESEYCLQVTEFASAVPGHHIYGCRRDLALIFSAWARRSERMIGRLPPPVAAEQPVQIDIGERAGLALVAHSHAFGDTAVLEDVRELVMHERAPADRGRLTRVTTTMPPYWRLT